MTPMEVFARSRNVLLVGSAAAAGIVLPPIAFVEALTMPIVAVLMYISLRGIDLRGSLTVLRPVPIAIGFLVTYVVMPTGSLVLGPVLASDNTRVGLYIVAAVPTTAGSSIVWTKLSQGDVELASLIAVASIAVSPLVTPSLLSGLLGSTVMLSPLAIVSDLVLVVCGGVALRVALPTSALSESQVDSCARTAIAILVYASVSQLSVSQLHVDLPRLFASVALLLVLGLVMSVALYRVFGLNPGVRSAIFYSGSLKNLGVGLLVVDILSVPAATVVIVTYYLLQQLVGAITSELLFP